MKCKHKDNLYLHEEGISWVTHQVESLWEGDPANKSLECTDSGLIEVEHTGIWRVECEDCGCKVRSQARNLPEWARDAVRAVEETR